VRASSGVHDHAPRLVPRLEGDLTYGQVAEEVYEDDAVAVGVGDDRDAEIPGDRERAS
jgi:hypothetical protein